VIQQNSESGLGLKYSEELTVLDSKTSPSQIKNVKLYKPVDEKAKSYLILMTESKAIAINADFCGLKTSRKACDASIYPYCSWSTKQNKCLSLSEYKSELDRIVHMSKQTTGMYSSLRKIDSKSTMQSLSAQNEVLTPSAVVLPTRANVFYQLDENKIVFSMSFNSFFVLFVLISVLFCVLFVVLVKVFVRKSRTFTLEDTESDSSETKISKLEYSRHKYLNRLKKLWSAFKNSKNEEEKSSGKSTTCSISSEQCDHETVPSSMISTTSPSSTGSDSSSLTKLSSVSNNQQFLSQHSRRIFANPTSQSVICTHPKTTLMPVAIKFKDYDSAEYYLPKKTNNNYVQRPSQFLMSNNSTPLDPNNLNANKFYL
jgi:hypothetical protein